MKKEMNIPGYTFRDMLYEGGNTVVYRAINNKNNKAVIIKCLKENGAASIKAAKLAREFDTLENMHVEGVVEFLLLIMPGRRKLNLQNF